MKNLTSKLVGGALLATALAGSGCATTSGRQNLASVTPQLEQSGPKTEQLESASPADYWKSLPFESKKRFWDIAYLVLSYPIHY